MPHYFSHAQQHNSVARMKVARDTDKEIIYSVECPGCDSKELKVEIDDSGWCSVVRRREHVHERGTTPRHLATHPLPLMATDGQAHWREEDGL